MLLPPFAYVLMLSISLLPKGNHRLDDVYVIRRIPIGFLVEYKPLCVLWDSFAVRLFEPYLAVAMLRHKVLHVFDELT